MQSPSFFFHHRIGTSQILQLTSSFHRNHAADWRALPPQDEPQLGWFRFGFTRTHVLASFHPGRSPIYVRCSQFKYCPGGILGACFLFNPGGSKR